MLDSECMYCTKNEALLNIMIPICDVDGFPLYLNRNQTYRGRTILAYDNHTGKIADMEMKRGAEFFSAVQKVTKAITEVFNPRQINLGTFGDKMCHVHFHIVPKYEGGVDFGGVFQMNPQPEVRLNEEEYDEMIKSIRESLQNQK